MKYKHKRIGLLKMIVLVYLGWCWWRWQTTSRKTGDIHSHLIALTSLLGVSFSKQVALVLAEKQLTFLCDFRTLRSDYVNAKEKVTSKIDVNTETLCLAVSLFFSSSTLSIQQSQLHFRPHNFLPLQTKNNWGIDITALLFPLIW